MHLDLANRSGRGLQRKRQEASSRLQDCGQWSTSLLNSLSISSSFETDLSL